MIRRMVLSLVGRFSTLPLGVCCLLAGLAVVFPLRVSAQVDCAELTTSSLTTVSALSYCHCVEIGGDGSTLLTNGFDLTAVEKIGLKPGVKARPAPGEKIRLRLDTPYTALTYPVDLAWIAPDPGSSDPGNVGSPGTGVGRVGLYEKMEIGLRLDSLVEEKVTNFLLDRPGDKLNPFDPDDIDIRAEFFHETPGIDYGIRRRHGFFFQDFTRDLDTAGLACCWDTVATQYRFRIRFTPRQLGRWCYRITVKVRGEPDLDLGLRPFNCRPSVAASKDFARVGASNRYFAIGPKTWFPVGINIPWPDFQYQGGATDGFAQYRDEVVGTGEYALYEQRIATAKKSGANSFRMLVAPWNFEIEFEELGNYSQRMTSARELDRLLEKCKELDLRMHLNLQVHYPFDVPSKFGHFNWDWGNESHYQTHYPGLYDSLANCIFNNPLEQPYCYADELPGVNTPKDFLQDSTARSWYKKRLRYMVARWGYSPNIYLMELMSEINNLGSQTEWEEPGCDRGPNYASPSAQDPDYPGLLNDWQREMCRYIKHDLGHKDHMLAVNYTGRPNTTLNQTDNCNILLGDSSYFSEDVDVWTYNRYEGDVFRLGKIVEDHYNLNDPLNASVYINKPLIYSEVGNSPEMQECDNGISFIRALILGSFTGVAAAPMDWHYRWRTDYWSYLRVVNRVMNQIDWNEGGWTPFLWESKSRSVEAIGLRTIEKPQRFVGAIFNRTINQHTVGENLFPCAGLDTAFAPLGLGTLMQKGTIVEDDHFSKVKGRSPNVLENLFMKNETYLYQQFNVDLNPLLGTIPFQKGITANSNPNILPGDQFLPIMVLDTNLNAGLNFFIIYRYGDAPFGLN